MQKALSNIFRTGERFGAQYNINLLLGKTDERVERFKHDKLSTFGIGLEYSEFQWKSIFRQMIALNLVDVDMDSYGIIKLNPSSHEVLKGKRKIFLSKDIQTQKTKEKTKISKIKSDFDPENELFKELKQLRLSLAKEKKLALYDISHQTLHGMADLKPQSLEEMSRISGVGDAFKKIW